MSELWDLEPTLAFADLDDIELLGCTANSAQTLDGAYTSNHSTRVSRHPCVIAQILRRSSASGQRPYPSHLSHPLRRRPALRRPAL